jgi:hypothetical protein
MVPRPLLESIRGLRHSRADFGEVFMEPLSRWFTIPVRVDSVVSFSQIFPSFFPRHLQSKNELCIHISIDSTTATKLSIAETTNIYHIIHNNYSSNTPRLSVLFLLTEGSIAVVHGRQHGFLCYAKKCRFELRQTHSFIVARF